MEWLFVRQLKVIHTPYHEVQIFEGCNFRGLPKSRSWIPAIYFRGSLVITSCTSSVLHKMDLMTITRENSEI